MILVSPFLVFAYVEEKEFWFSILDIRAKVLTSLMNGIKKDRKSLLSCRN
jgi:hypothetical protein